jgi:Uma2 family endonuclease
MPLPKPDQRYTYQDYLTWDDDQRWEIINGYVYSMSPAPNVRHQRISRNMSTVLDLKLSNTKCESFSAPIDVVLSKQDVVQPDIVIVCEPDIITEKNIQGVPTVVIEILSPSTAKKDRIDKRNLYERSGVREYLLVDPDGRYIECYRLSKDKQYKKSEYYTENDELVLQSVKDLKIDVSDIFADIR